MVKYIFLAVLNLFTYSAFAQIDADSVGIFAVKDGKAVRMDLLRHKRIKTSGAWGFALTGGLASIKTKLEFGGETSDYRFRGKAKMRMYFGTPPIEKMASLYMFTPNYTIKDFEISRFQVKKGRRRLTNMSVSIIGSSMGADNDDEVCIHTTKVKDGVYDLEVSGPAGEYCVIFSNGGAGSGFTGVYDFTIE